METKTCGWKKVARETFQTGCGVEWFMDAESPQDNGYEFCPNCGKKIYFDDNALRISRAKTALKAWLDGLAPDEDESDIVDLMTDLCHLASSRGHSVAEIMERSMAHWIEESKC
jgi:hypothetical protein